MSATAEQDARAAVDEEKERLRNLGELTAEADGELEEGSGQQLLDLGGTLNLKLGGMKPTESVVKIKSISLPVRGQLDDKDDDEVITLLVTARVDGTHMDKSRASDGRVTKKVRRHVLTPITVLPVTPGQADKLLGLE